MGQEATHGHTLPPQPTSFVGRENEVADVTATLTDPACRLLTLAGPGGSGKTRLAIQVASDLLDTHAFSDGVYFVPLQSVTEVEFFTSAIADALTVSLSGQEEAEVHLLNYLRDKELLLVLDNVEQLLDTGSLALLVDMLNAAPAVTVLVTSREVLQLREEWLYPIHGLPVPDDEDAEDFDAYEAVQLFVERARRVRPDFSPAEERRDIVRVCRLVDGLPLAIELAASWRRTLRCASIADEIERSIAFLETDLRNVPDRHGSMRAVFDHSWQLLTPEERNVFKRLSVFRGGFRREAAEEVAGTSLSVLSTLVDKSLLRCEPNGRYQVHELLRQYAEEKLEASAMDATDAHEAHCMYYAEFLRSCTEEALSGGRQLEMKAKIAADLDNVRKAWRRAVDRGDADAIGDGATALYLFYQYESRYREGADAFERAVQSLDCGPDAILAELLVRYALFCIRLGQLDTAEAALQRSRALHAGLETPPDGYANDPVAVLGILAAIRGEYDAVARLGEEARRRSEAHGHKWNQPTAYYVLTQAAQAKGEYQAAQKYARRAYALVEALDEHWFMAYCHNELGNVARAMGRYDDARHHYRASYDIREAFDDPEGMAVALTHLGNVALLQKDYDEAGRCYERSLTIYEDVSDRGGRATALEGLGRVACETGDYEIARQQLYEALEIAADIRFVPRILSILISAGELLLHTGHAQRGLELLEIACHHAAGNHEIKGRAEQVLADHRNKPSEDVHAATERAPADTDLDTVVADLQAELAVPTVVEGAEEERSKGAEERAGAPAPPHSGSSALIEPLTDRERDVLELLAEGYTNREIAEELIIAVGTVKSHNHHIYGKLGVKNRAEAVARAIELDLL